MIKTEQAPVCSYQARFDDSVKNVILKSGMIVVGNIGWLIFLTAVFSGLVFLCRYFIFLVVLLPGAHAFLVHHVFEHIYKKMGWIDS